MQNHVKMLQRKRQEMRSECILILLCNFVLTFSYRYIHTYFQITASFKRHTIIIQKACFYQVGAFFFFSFFFQKEISNLVKICEPSDSLDIYQPVEKKSCKKLNHKYGFTIGLVYIIQTLFLLFLLHIQRKVNDFVASSCELSTFLFFLLNRR